MYLQIQLKKVITFIFLSMLFAYSFAENLNNEISLASDVNVKKVKTSNQILIDFLTKTKSLKADFTHQQSNSSGKEITFTGKLIFRRPNRLRWEVKTPYAQLQL